MRGSLIDIQASQGRGKVYLSPDDGPRRLIMLCAGEGEEAVEIIDLLEKRKDLAPLALCMPFCRDWDTDYTPWPTDALNGRNMPGGAKAHLDWILGAFMTEVNRLVPGCEPYGICGYSLGGLFALWAAAFEDTPFCAAGSASGALWYPEFAERFAERDLTCLQKAYISLGLKEAKMTRGPMASNKAATEGIAALLKARLGDENVLFEWNNGNHFFEVPQRIAKAIVFMCKLNS